MWNGTAETLKQKPTARRPTARKASVALGPDAIACARASSRVEPCESRKENAIP